MDRHEAAEPDPGTVLLPGAHKRPAWAAEPSLRDLLIGGWAQELVFGREEDDQAHRRGTARKGRAKAAPGKW